MPLRHHPQVSGFSPWNRNGFHGNWATYIMAALNQHILPPDYHAVSTTRVSTQAQIDIGTILHAESETAEVGNSIVATAVWAPPQPMLVVETDLADIDVFEIAVVQELEGYELVAAIELVSTANKDRPEHRHAFAAKCAAYLQNQIGLIVVDIVTDRRANMHAELMDLLGLGDGSRAAITSDLYAVAYRAVANDDKPPRLEMWPAELRVGAVLPTLPLWIAPDRAVPLDLEASYTETCAALRLP